MISVIIPAYNEEAYIGNCLSSVLRYKTASVREILVVDNASTDGTAAIAKSFPNVRVVTEPRKGITSARQRGLLSARGDILVWIDADTHLRAGWLEHVERAFAEDPVLVSASGPYDYADLPSLQRWATWFIWTSTCRIMHAITGSMIIGGNFAVRKRALEEIGGFDTGISFYAEDENIARRLRPLGRQLFSTALYLPSSGRRLRFKGAARMGMLYAINSLWERIFRIPFTTAYEDVR